MKLRKLAAVAASCAVAVSALSVTASAGFVEKTGNGHFISNASMWMPLLYSDGTVDVADGKEYTDYGLDLSQIGSIEITVKPDDELFFDGQFGGGVILSSAKTDHNWPSKNFWGVVDEDAEIDSLNTEEAVQFQKVGDYTYKGVCTVDDSNCVLPDTHLVQLAIQEWGNSPLFDMEVIKVDVLDKSGNLMISFDENGKANLDLIPEGGAAEEPAAEEPAADEDDDDASAVDAAEADDADDDDVDADDADADDDDDDADDADDAAEAPAQEAPAAGNTAAPTAGGSKDSPDTGAADVAAVAGLALVATGVAIVAKKRK